MGVNEQLFSARSCLPLTRPPLRCALECKGLSVRCRPCWWTLLRHDGLKEWVTKQRTDHLTLEGQGLTIVGSALHVVSQALVRAGVIICLVGAKGGAISSDGQKKRPVISPPPATSPTRLLSSLCLHSSHTTLRRQPRRHVPHHRRSRRQVIRRCC